MWRTNKKMPTPTSRLSRIRMAPTMFSMIDWRRTVVGSTTMTTDMSGSRMWQNRPVTGARTLTGTGYGDRGWFWDSNEDFGWATYHYGRWIRVAGTGWVWVPGDQWAPGWVSWRQTDNDDYVGWAPLPPEASFSANVGFQPWCDSYYDIGPAAFAFIRIGDFCRPSYREFCAPQQQNLILIDRTTNITNITYNNNVIYNNGPRYQRVSQLVQQQAGQQIPTYKINYAAQTQRNAAFKTAAQGNQLNVIAPPQKLKPIATAQPQVAKQLGKAQVERGWQSVPQGQAE